MKKTSLWAHGFVLAAAVIFLVTCITGCSTLNSGAGTAPVVLKGVFMDGPVGGLGYATQTLHGVTKADGIFEYKAGETVTFSVGSLKLGSTVGKPIVTPLDIVADAKDISDQRVANICVLLQTLDQDGTPENGIMLSEKAVEFVSKYGEKINFNSHVRRFSFDPGLRAVLAELNNIDAFGDIPRAVKPAKVAQKHLKTTLEELKKKAENPKE